MKDLLRDIFYMGAGAAFMTKEKVEELKKELIDKGKMTQEEGKQFVDDLVKNCGIGRPEAELMALLHQELHTPDSLSLDR